MQRNEANQRLEWDASTAGFAVCFRAPQAKRLEVTVQIHGYANEDIEIEDIVPAELAEITLVATPEELRRIARFLENCANGMEAHGKSWEHEHLSDKDRYFQNSPHFVVFNPEHGQ